MEIEIRIIPENETEIELGTHVHGIRMEFEVTPWSCVSRNATIIITPSF